MPSLILKRAPIGWNLTITTCWRAASSPHLQGADRAAGPAVDVGERPQRPHTPRGARLRADARDRDGGVREELAAGVVLRSGGGSAFGGKPENIYSFRALLVLTHNGPR